MSQGHNEPRRTISCYVIVLLEKEMPPSHVTVCSGDMVDFVTEVKRLKKNRKINRCYLMEASPLESPTVTALRKIFSEDEFTTTFDSDPPRRGDGLLIVVAYSQPPNECSSGSSLQQCKSFATRSGVPDSFVNLDAAAVDKAISDEKDPKKKSVLKRRKQYVYSPRPFFRYGITSSPWNHSSKDIMMRAGYMQCDLQFQRHLIEAGNVFSRLAGYGATMVIRAEERHMQDDRSDTAMYIANAVATSTALVPTNVSATRLSHNKMAELLIEIEGRDKSLERGNDHEVPLTVDGRVPPIDALVARAAIRRSIRAARGGARRVSCRVSKVINNINQALRSPEDFAAVRRSLSTVELEEAVRSRGGIDAAVAYGNKGPRALSEATKSATMALLLHYGRGYCTEVTMTSMVDSATVNIPLQWLVIADMKSDSECLNELSKSPGVQTCFDEIMCARSEKYANIMSVLYTLIPPSDSSFTISYSELRRRAGLSGTVGSIELPGRLLNEISSSRLDTMPSNIRTAELAPRLPRTQPAGTDFDANLIRTVMVTGPVMKRLLDEPGASVARTLEIYEQEAELREPVIFGAICTKPELCVQNKRHLPRAKKNSRRIVRNNGIDGPIVAANEDDTTRTRLLLMRMRAATAATKFIGARSVHPYLRNIDMQR